MKVLTLIKKGHTFLFHFESQDTNALIQAMVDKANDPMCPLDWFDVAVLSMQLPHPGVALVKEKIAQALALKET